MKSIAKSLIGRKRVSSVPVVAPAVEAQIIHYVPSTNRAHELLERGEVYTPGRFSTEFGVPAEFSDALVDSIDPIVLDGGAEREGFLPRHELEGIDVRAIGPDESELDEAEYVAKDVLSEKSLTSTQRRYRFKPKLLSREESLDLARRIQKSQFAIHGDFGLRVHDALSLANLYVGGAHKELTIIGQSYNHTRFNRMVNGALGFAPQLLSDFNLFVECNIGLAAAGANRFGNGDLTFRDKLQEATLGVMKAVERFDPSLGYAFSTYATWWIMQGIDRAIKDKGRLIRAPVHLQESQTRIYKTRVSFLAKYNREPTDPELAKISGESLEKIKLVDEVFRNPRSLDVPVGEESDTTFYNFVPDESKPNNSETFARTQLETAVEFMLGKMVELGRIDEKKEDILRLRFGINGDGSTLTLEEVGQKHNLTRERIRQLQNEALAKAHLFIRANYKRFPELAALKEFGEQ